jgi:uncharacterized protein (DUF1684 family)
MMQLPALSLAALLLGAATYTGEIEKWRADREAGLKKPDSWLSLTGLFWLKEGANRAGSDPSSRVLLPEGAPRFFGTLIREGRTVRFQPADGEARVLKSDKDGDPDILETGSVSLYVIERGDQVGVRMKDRNSPYLRDFTGLRWYPVDEAWRIEARWLPYAQPKQMTFEAQAGGAQRMISPGYAEFEKKGRKFRMIAVDEGDQLWFIFRDRTAGKTTYAAARFLYAAKPRNGSVVLDFNKAYNPPCVFTPYATCPLPPPENRLPIAVEAGEMMYEGH